MDSTNAPPPTYQDVRAAAGRLRPWVHRTPLLSSTSLSEKAGVEVRLKCENLQRAGSFKIRGAMNALLQLKEEQRSRGVVAFSSGNHAQGVALAAKLLRVPATIVMPEGSSPQKIAATEAYGATVVTEGVTQLTRDQIASEIAAKNGAALIPPFDHPHVIAGAGTAALEIMEEWPGVEHVITPVGGGGLLAGTALSVNGMNSEVCVYGVEPRAGNDGEQSFRKGEIVRIDPPVTIADGARTVALGQLNFPIIRELVRDIVSVEDAVLLETMRFATYRTKLLIEPTAALGIAALLSGLLPVSGPVAIVISGGNLDMSLLAGPQF